MITCASDFPEVINASSYGMDMYFRFIGIDVNLIKMLLIRCLSICVGFLTK